MSDSDSEQPKKINIREKLESSKDFNEFKESFLEFYDKFVEDRKNTKETMKKIVSKQEKGMLNLNNKIDQLKELFEEKNKTTVKVTETKKVTTKKKVSDIDIILDNILSDLDSFEKKIDNVRKSSEGKKIYCLVNIETNKTIIKSDGWYTTDMNILGKTISIGCKNKAMYDDPKWKEIVDKLEERNSIKEDNNEE